MAGIVVGAFAALSALFTFGSNGHDGNDSFFTTEYNGVTAVYEPDAMPCSSFKDRKRERWNRTPGFLCSTPL